MLGSVELAAVPSDGDPPEPEAPELGVSFGPPVFSPRDDLRPAGSASSGASVSDEGARPSCGLPSATDGTPTSADEFAFVVDASLVVFDSQPEQPVTPREHINKAEQAKSSQHRLGRLASFRRKHSTLLRVTKVIFGGSADLMAWSRAGGSVPESPRIYDC